AQRPVNGHVAPAAEPRRIKVVLVRGVNLSPIGVERGVHNTTDLLPRGSIFTHFKRRNASKSLSHLVLLLLALRLSRTRTRIPCTPRHRCRGRDRHDPSCRPPPTVDVHTVTAVPLPRSPT